MLEEGPARDLLSEPVEEKDLDEAIREAGERQPWPLTAAQREAVRLALRSRMMALAGYAGSDKTTVLRTICDAAERFGLEMRLMALSGRAAQRMAASTGRTATTIASFMIGMKGREPLDAGTMLVIDEASMVDLPTFWRVLRHIGEVRLLLVGDPAQLPPIGFGLVFHALMEAEDIPRVILGRVMRQSEASGIPAVAAIIREGRMPDLPAFEGKRDGVSFVPCRPEETIGAILSVGRVLRAEGVERGDVQIIAPYRRGPAGIDAINAALHARHVARMSGVRAIPGRPDIAEGEPIIWTKNDWDRGLMNGSMGRILSVFPGGAGAAGEKIRGAGEVGAAAARTVALAELDGRKIILDASDADRIELAYAISIHRAQGSQWERVVVAWPQEEGFASAVIYTAVTRAVRQAIVVGGRPKFGSGRRLVECGLTRRLFEAAAISADARGCRRP